MTTVATTAKARLLIVEDDANIVDSLQEYLTNFNYAIDVAATGNEALDKVTSGEYNLVLLDVHLPDLSGMEVLKNIKENNSDLPVLVMTGYISTDSAIEAMKLGAHEFITKPFDLDQLSGMINRLVKKTAPIRGLAPFSKAPKPEEGTIIGMTPEMVEIAKIIGQVARSDASVLILGESGTGKELVARSVYANSLRADKPFLSVNCAALPETLLESELFGHEKGSFTGAYTRKLGKFEQCNAGSIFLDEIADMSLITQSKVLRVLQQQEFERVGGNSTIKVDVRVIAATNKSLVNLIKDGQFRVDLYYRLKVVSLYLPPLRERRADIPLLADHFIRMYARQTNRKELHISKEALNGLMKYPWPGNVRELENNFHSAVVMSKGDVLMPEHFPILSGEVENVELDLSQVEDDYCKMFSDIIDKNFEKIISISGDHIYQHLNSALEKAMISAALKYTKSNQVKSSELLGVSRNTLRDRISKYGLF
ncbi:MAG: sigma-54-dependent Fis family transcriptional regulator [candidate division Zixibacteria bacterium]|nr:sigma-54-dependent Fis family transcriptional regulator [candidate division Zixibacteria bacterium]